ncbi:MAG: hypothetical protein ACI4JC_02790 [Faecalibacterium sp.]
MTEETTKDVQNVRVLRLFGASGTEVRQAAQALPQKWALTAQCRSRGGETLVALQAKTPEALEKGEQSLRACFPDALYGVGGQSLAAAAVQALEKHKRLLVCADAAVGALIEGRLEAVEGAEKVFDFGAMSYTHPKTGPKIAAQAARHAPVDSPLGLEGARVQAAQKLVGAELCAGCVERENCIILLLGTKKGCWVRTVLTQDNPGLWLLDMVRRAACDLKQAEGTRWYRWRDKLPADEPLPEEHPDKTSSVPSGDKSSRPRRHPLRWLLLIVLLAALVGFAAAWYYTNGDLSSLPELLGWESVPHAGASFL